MPQNLSFILNKPFDVTFAQQPKPELTSPHDVLVAINYTGICGSDVHYWEHGRIGSFVLKEPMVYASPFSSLSPSQFPTLPIPPPSNCPYTNSSSLPIVSATNPPAP
ncbi:MAG: hypothetical protein CL912_07270 [Deltaproteobacteria bacterium]|nr:hypothetical protein [Deltaproteobacteria bacterium]